MCEINIKDYGAKETGCLQTAIIQKAIDDCFLNGGGRVIIPAGFFRTGGLRLRSNVTLYLKSGAVLEGSDNPEEYMAYKNDTVEPISLDNPKNLSGSVYPYSRWCNALIRAINAENVAIVGEENSYIDGVDCYDALGEEKYRGPHAICIWDCKNITLKGYTIRNSANWAHAIFRSCNISADNISVFGGHDGFDIRTCDNVTVENSTFDTGDDAIAGFDNINVVVRNCLLNSSCSCTRFGGTDVLFENCRAYSPSGYNFRGMLTPEQKASRASSDRAVPRRTSTAFKYYCDFRAEIRKTPGNIVFRNCEFDSVKHPMLLLFDGNHIWCCNRSLSSVTFENCRFENVCEPMLVHGDCNEPVSLTFRNIYISAESGRSDIPVMELCNYTVAEFDNVKLTGFKKPRITTYSDGNVVVSDTELAVEKACNPEGFIEKLKKLT